MEAWAFLNEVSRICWERRKRASEIGLEQIGIHRLPPVDFGSAISRIANWVGLGESVDTSFATVDQALQEMVRRTPVQASAKSRNLLSYLKVISWSGRHLSAAAIRATVVTRTFVSPASIF